jgi:hypothetical protein
MTAFERESSLHPHDTQPTTAVQLLTIALMRVAMMPESVYNIASRDVAVYALRVISAHPGVILPDLAHSARWINHGESGIQPFGSMSVKEGEGTCSSRSLTVFPRAIGLLPHYAAS